MPATPAPTPTSYTYWDPGGCNCPQCNPCPLPVGSNLTVTITNLIPATVSGTLVYSHAAPFHLWGQSACLPLSGSGFKFRIACHETNFCTTYWMAAYNDIACVNFAADFFYYNPTSCGTGPTMTLTSATCSPLNVVLHGTGGIGGLTITITP